MSYFEFTWWSLRAPEERDRFVGKKTPEFYRFPTKNTENTKGGTRFACSIDFAYWN